MQDFAINYFAVIVASLVKVALGAVWFNFRFNIKAWEAATGLIAADTKQRARIGVSVDIVSTLVLAWILAHVIAYAGVTDIRGGLKIGFLCWLGFVLALRLPALIWDKRNPRFFVSSQAFTLIAFLAMGGIIADWA